MNINTNHETANESYIRQTKISALQEDLLRQVQSITNTVNKYNSVVAQITEEVKITKKNTQTLKPFIFNLKGNNTLLLDYFPKGNMSNPKQVEILANNDYVLAGNKISYTRGGEILNINDLDLFGLQRFLSSISIIKTY